jgi:hypothetical protein
MVVDAVIRTDDLKMRSCTRQGKKKYQHEKPVGIGRGMLM